METSLEDVTALAVPGEPGLPALAAAAVEAGTAPATRRAYTLDWRAFIAWCEREGRQPLPASGDTLTAYVTYLCYEWVPARDGWKYEPGDGRPRGMKPASVERARAAIAAAHRTACVPKPDVQGTIKVLKGYRALLAASHDPRAKPRRATVVTPDDLRQMFPEIPSDDVRTLRDYAMLALDYCTGARASELTALNVEDVSPGPEGLRVWVYRMKTRKAEDVAIPRKDAPDSVRVVTAWLEVLAGQGRTSGPLFVRLSRPGTSGKIAFGAPAGPGGGDPDGRMNEKQVTRVLRKHAGRAGLEGRWTSHGLRRGMATTSHRAGNDRYAIARQGGWDKNSRALDGYIEDGDMWTENALRGAGL